MFKEIIPILKSINDHLAAIRKATEQPCPGEIRKLVRQYILPELQKIGHG